MVGERLANQDKYRMHGRSVAGPANEESEGAGASDAPDPHRHGYPGWGPNPSRQTPPLRGAGGGCAEAKPELPQGSRSVPRNQGEAGSGVGEGKIQALAIYQFYFFFFLGIFSRIFGTGAKILIFFLIGFFGGS